MRLETLDAAWRWTARAILAALLACVFAFDTGAGALMLIIVGMAYLAGRLDELAKQRDLDRMDEGR